MKTLKLILLVFCSNFYGSLCYANSDSSSVAPITTKTFLQTFVLASATIPKVAVAIQGPNIVYLYFNTQGKKCPVGMPIRVVINLAALASKGILQSFAISPTGFIPTPTWETNLQIPVYGDQGYKLYGAGYYQTYGLELEILPEAPDPPYPAYADILYTFYCQTPSS